MSLTPFAGEDLISTASGARPYRFWVQSDSTLPQQGPTTAPYTLNVVTAIDIEFRSGATNPYVGFTLNAAGVSTGIIFVTFQFTTANTTQSWRGWLPTYNGDNLYASGTAGGLFDWCVSGLQFPNSD